MATRQTRLVIKNSVIPSQTLPSSGVLQGEGLVNIGDGILYFTGGTSGSPTWVDSGNATSGYFEVGSNLNQLKIRDKIISYSGVTNLTGKFLSGTSTGFVLSDISSIGGGADSYVTGATWNPNFLSLNLNNGKPTVTATIDSFTALTINGNLSVTGTETVNNLTITGTGLYNTTAAGSNPLEIVNYSSLTAFSQTNDVYVTGSTLTSATNNTNNQSSQLLYHGTPIGGPYSIVTQNTFTTGGTFNSGTEAIDFKRNDGVTYSVSLSGIDINDTYVTGFTYNPSSNTLTISQNEGESPLTASINTVSGLTVSNLTSGRVIFAGTGGILTDDNGFTYNSGTDTLGVQNIEAAGDVVVQGSLTVFGPSVSAFTSNLYVEDPNITLNYNPTGSTTLTSVNAGFTIQDGNGNTSGNVNLDIVRMQNLTGLTANNVPNVSEYVALTGYSNRGWITQLNDIVIRSTDVSDGGSAGDFNGVRVLAEFDILDGGSY
jgi:hypothetical protein